MLTPNTAGSVDPSVLLFPIPRKWWMGDPSGGVPF